MVVLVPGPARLDTRAVSCWTASDARLGIFVAFVGRATQTNATQASSRIQAHVFSIGGLASYTRLTVNPSSALYAAVGHLPRDLQGDEDRRGLAVSLLKYFTDMAPAVKKLLSDKVAALPPGSAGGSEPGGGMASLFDAAHAADLAARMERADNAEEMASKIEAGMAERSLSWLDVDVVLPDGSISLIRPAPPEGRASLVPLPDLRPEVDFGDYNTLLDLLGDAAFLPTSRMRRAPSKPTAVSRNRVLDKDKEDELRREMHELLATERSYVAKLADLEQSAAATYARNLEQRAGRKPASGDLAMKTLFPSSLSKILALNEHFLQALESITEAAATGSGNHARSLRDPTGVLAFSKTMLEYFPLFREPYQSYLKNSGQHSRILSELLQDRTSPWAKAIVSSGEQQLKSLLIEPVQRLPRYSLFIDNMASTLPADHPAMSRFLRARDIITEICALESDEPLTNVRTLERLHEIVANWPQGFGPTGRLVTAVDAIQLSPPYTPDPYGRDGEPYVILLFADYLVFLRKTANMSSRGLLAEIDRPTNTSSGAAAQAGPFSFSHFMPLVSSRFLESNSSRLFHVDGLAETADASRPGKLSSYETSDIFQLLGSYDGKAGKFSEDVALALTEGRFPEQMRENDKWTLKSLPPSGSDGLGLISAVMQTDDLVRLTCEKAILGRTRIVVDRSTSKQRDPNGNSINSGVEIIVNITVMADDKFTVEVMSYGRQASIDAVAKNDFVNLLVKRLGYVLRVHNRPFNEDTAYATISLAREVAVALQPRVEPEQAVEVALAPAREGSRRFRPFSPVKGLSSILAGGSSQPGSPTKQLSGRRRGLSTKAAVAPVLTPAETSTISNQDRFEQRPGSRDPASQVEAIFNTYVVALHTRKGNIVGRVIHNRSAADELAVNELYNTLLTNPADHQAAAEVPVDVLFAAFEKFLNAAWKQKAGPIVPPAILREMQTLLFSDVPGMVQQFKTIMSEMPRMNQRAFKSLIGVLAELVGATSNDGDRGALVMTFAEVLVVEGDPVEYIMLFDRLLADADILFGIQPPGPAAESQPDRTRSANTGSIGSTASSIGKKLGFFSGLSRGNSKASESESRVTHVLRQLSKRSNADSESTPPSISRSFLSRGRSADSRPTTPGSSVSRLGSSYSSQNAESPRPGSAHGLVKSLAPIDEGKMGPPTTILKKKRRSSLSDLPDTAQVHRHGSATPQTPGHLRPTGLQKTPSTSAVMGRGRPNLFSDIKPLNVSDRRVDRNASPGDASPPRNTKSPTPSGPSIIRTDDVPQLLSSRTPYLSPTKVSQGNPNKLKVQSPSKLRERLEKEKQAMGGVGPELQAELASIGRELSALKPSGSQQGARSPVESLQSRVAAFETTLRTRLDELGQRTDEIRADYESSLAVSEKKAKNLDELYREANVENELLYDRFNGELTKVLKAVRGNTRDQDCGIQEMRKALEEAQNEAARLRKENQRLRRENLGLRSQLRD